MTWMRQSDKIDIGVAFIWCDSLVLKIEAAFKNCGCIMDASG